jgi:hypothetical protein
MIRKASFNLLVLIGIAFFAACRSIQISPAPQMDLSNPASV